MKNQPDAPVATSYTKTHEGGQGYDETPLAFITVKVDEQKLICIPSALLRVLVQDLVENHEFEPTGGV